MRQTAKSLADIWLAGISGDSDETLVLDDVALAIDRGLAAARTRHPDVRVTDEDLVMYALARADGHDPFSPERTTDLLLACGLSRGDAAALRSFDTEIVPLITPALERLRLDRSRLDEAIQRLRVELFIGMSDGPPRIEKYRATGDLVGWLKVTATRLALRAQKQEKAGVGSDDDLFDRLPDARQNVELDVLRAKYKEPFREAFREAICGLGDRERTILRQHHADGLSIDALAPIHGVHRATVARWIVAAENAVLQRTRSRFRAILSASPAECESVMRLLKGELSMSLRWLAS